jgi:uncharacterized protein YdaU (DUF1376 family)
MKDAKERPPAFQLYPADFLADENVVVMTNQEAGCYIKLLCYCWREGSIPSEIPKIAKLCGESSSNMAQLWTAIEMCFSSAIDNPSRLRHPRLERERKKQEQYRAERSESGTKGANARWNMDLPGNNGNSTANGSASGSASKEPIAKNGSSSSSSSSKTNTGNPPSFPNKNPEPEDPDFDGSEWTLKTCKAYPLWKDPDALTVSPALGNLYMEVVEREAPARGGKQAAAEWLLARVVQFAKQHKEAGTEDRYIPSLKNWLTDGSYASVQIPVVRQQKPEMTQEEAIALAQKRDDEARVRKAAREAEIAARKRRQRGGE